MRERIRCKLPHWWKLWKLTPGPPDVDQMVERRGGKFTWSRPPPPSASQVDLQLAPAHPAAPDPTHTPHPAQSIAPSLRLISIRVSFFSPPCSAPASPPQGATAALGSPARPLPHVDSPSATAPGVEGPSAAVQMEKSRAAAGGPRRHLLQVPSR
jgi:hypothetical protein